MLVDADKAKAKLAKVVRDPRLFDAYVNGPLALCGRIAGAIQQTDLLDCAPSADGGLELMLLARKTALAMIGAPGSEREQLVSDAILSYSQSAVIEHLKLLTDATNQLGRALARAETAETALSAAIRRAANGTKWGHVK